MAADCNWKSPVKSVARKSDVAPVVRHPRKFFCLFLVVVVLRDDFQVFAPRPSLRLWLGVLGASVRFAIV